MIHSLPDFANLVERFDAAECSFVSVTQPSTQPRRWDGGLDLAALDEALDDDVLLISIMAVNNEIGVIQPLELIASAAKECGALFHCDAAQAPCAFETSTLATYADLISLSAHKIYGPKGIGALYVRRDLHDRIEPLIYGGGQQDNLRSGTIPVPLCVGMATAVELMKRPSTEKERKAISALSDRFIDHLAEVGIAFSVNGPSRPARHPGNISICFHGSDAHEILGALQPYLAASTGSACTTQMPEPSHVLRAIGLTEEEANATIRFSIGRQTSVAEIERAVRLIARTLASLYDNAGQPQSNRA